MQTRHSARLGARGSGQKGKQDQKKTPSNRMALKTVSENAGTPAAFDDTTHGNVTLGNCNSVDKVVDKDPKSQHEDTVKGHEEKPEETVASLNSCLGSDSTKVCKLVAEKEVLLQPRYNVVEAHTIIQELALAFSLLEADHTKLTTENDQLQERGQALDVENISLLEEKHENSREIEKLNRSLNTRQQVLDESMRLLNVLTEVVVDRNATIAKLNDLKPLDESNGGNKGKKERTLKGRPRWA